MHRPDTLAAQLRCSAQILWCLLTLAGAVHAHDRTSSYSAWEIHGASAEVVVRLAEIDVTRFDWAATGRAEREKRLGRYLGEHLRLEAAGQPCAIREAPRVIAAAPSSIAVAWKLTCSDPRQLTIRSSLLFDVAPAHLHFARVQRDGAAEVERVLSNRSPTWTLEDTDSQPGNARVVGTGVLGYVRLGVEHILSGYDHLAFVFALLLIGGTLREVAKVVTGFTVAHSITLALTVLGYVHPARAPIEALIGMSIALVATENVWLLGGRGWLLPLCVTIVLVALGVLAQAGYGAVPPLTWAGLALFVGSYFGLLRTVRNYSSPRWAIAFIFGLAHGFGFAAVLAEAGLATGRVVPALFGFNAGVEIGQLAVILCAWPALAWLTRSNPSRYQWVVEVGSSAIAALGIFLFISRAYG